MAQNWMEIQKFCKGSVICSSNLFQYNWFWIEDFMRFNSSGDDRHFDVDPDNLLDGLDLTNKNKHDLFLTVNNTGLNHYVYAVCTKLLVINSAGIQVG
jgi:hypothetical protein